jgi:dynein intermediate chain, cytosolic
VQTTAIETDSPDAYEEEIRQRVMKERDQDAERLARDKALEELEVKLEKQIEQEIKGDRQCPEFGHL